MPQMHLLRMNASVQLQLTLYSATALYMRYQGLENVLSFSLGSMMLNGRLGVASNLYCFNAAGIPCGKALGIEAMY